MICAVVGARPHGRDVGDRAVRDPHLRAVQDPVGAVALRGRAHRARVGARVGLGEPEAADRGRPRASAAASAASAPRSPSARSRTSRASPAPRRASARPSRRPRAPCTSARTRRRSHPGGRSPRDACRRGRAARPPSTSSCGRIPCSNHSPTSGTIRSRTNWRTVSRIAFSSSSRSASIARKSRGSSAVCFAVVAIARIVEHGYCGGGQMRQGEREPRPGRAAPTAAGRGRRRSDGRHGRCPARESSWFSCSFSASKRVSLVADVERDQRPLRAERRAEALRLRVHVRPVVVLQRAEVEPLQAGRVGRVEVATPRLDDGERVRDGRAR